MVKKFSFVRIIECAHVFYADFANYCFHLAFLKHFFEVWHNLKFIIKKEVGT